MCPRACRPTWLSLNITWLGAMDDSCVVLPQNCHQENEKFSSARERERECVNKKTVHTWAWIVLQFINFQWQQIVIATHRMGREGTGAANRAEFEKPATLKVVNFVIFESSNSRGLSPLKQSALILQCEKVDDESHHRNLYKIRCSEPNVFQQLYWCGHTHVQTFPSFSQPVGGNIDININEQINE